ncbi:hypothetical protein AAHA92_26864 [Salvia divinorum]|uniref:Protein kinase domain-containing protein n=1 Tax=Salvia divinorum TaxID=28513 RepID=A0ABD1G1Y3_SALDI
MAIVDHVHGLCVFIFLITFPMIAFSNPDSEALLRLKSSFNYPQSLVSWMPGTEPCVNQTWVGVVCENGVVSGLRLAKLGLSGWIDVDALASISGLRSVVFTSNYFSGSIPNFNLTTSLTELHLTENMFSGQIPSDFFLKMVGLRQVWLSENNFSGPIPASLARLPELTELHLERNRFSGLIPTFEQRSLVSVNFSDNDLEGEIPLCLSRFGDDAFQGNAGLMKRKNRSSNEVLVTVFYFLIACAALLILMTVVLFVMRRRRGGAEAVKEEEDEREKKNVEDEQGKKNVEDPLTPAGGRRAVSSKPRFGARGDDLVFLDDEKGSFGMTDMMKAGAEVMKNGGMGSSFKTTMTGGMAVVVKRVKELNKIERGEFDEKIRWLGGLRHKNVLPLLAFYNGKQEKLLVYEFQPKGSLLLRLHEDQGSSPIELNWPLRLKIIQGIARGLDFLHTELSSLELPHGNLKSSNVMLSMDYEPLLADYGFWSLISQSPAAGSLVAFKAPEAMERNHISPQCDVYFLGVMILEILVRKFPPQYLSSAQGGTDLVLWARSAVAEEREGNMLDPDLANTNDSMQQMKQLAHIALGCTEDDPERRLGLRECVSRIEGLCVDRRSEHRAGGYEIVPDGYSDGCSSRRRRGSFGDQPGRGSFAF